MLPALGHFGLTGSIMATIVFMAQILITKKIWLGLTVIITAVILFFSLLWGISAGQQLAQAGLVAANANSIARGLQFFYQDQNRFPTAIEFQNRNIMLGYFNNFPPMEFISSGCPGSFIYKRTSSQKFQLDFCLPKAFQNFSRGWNVLQGNPAAPKAQQ